MLEQGVIEIAHRESTAWCGVDFAIPTGDDVNVTVELADLVDPSVRFIASLTVDDFVGGTTRSIGDAGDQMNAARVPGDELQIDIQRSSLVFDPGETWHFTCSPLLTGLGKAKANCRLKMVPSREQSPELWSDRTVVELDENGTGPPQKLALEMPREEGVYDLWIEMEPAWLIPNLAPANKTNWMTGRKIAIRRCVQVIVIDRDRSPSADLAESQWDLVEAFTPAQIAGTQRGAWTQAMLPRHRQIQRENVTLVDGGSEVSGESSAVTRMAAGGWFAIPLQTASVGKPLQISIDFTALPGTIVGCNIVSSLDDADSVGVASGIAVPASVTNQTTSESQGLHTFVVWPRSSDAWLVVTNNHEEQTADIGTVRFEACGDRIVSATEPASAIGDNLVPMRKRMVSLTPKQITALFGANRFLGDNRSQPVDDWTTFYEGTDRLIQYVKSAGYQGACITVAGDDGAIWPTTGVAMSPRFDSGPFHADGQDPVRKDVVEMMSRMFARENLTLAPIFKLGPEWAIGKTSAIDLADQFSARYREHSTMGDLILQFSTEGPLLPQGLPSPDDEEWQTFLASTGVEEPDLDESSDTDQENRRQQAWYQWRQEKLTAWYREIANAYRRYYPNRKTHIAATDLGQRPDIAASLNPSLHDAIDFGSAMTQAGLNISGDAYVETLCPERVANGQSLAQRRTEFGLRQSRQAQLFFADAGSSVLFEHRGAWKHFEGLESTGVVDAMNGPLVRLQQLTTAGGAARQRYTRQLLNNDVSLFIESGDTLPLGQEANLDSLASVLSQLPAQKFDEVPWGRDDKSNLPVVVRQYRQGDEHWFYAVNDTPWPMELELVVNTTGVQSSGPVSLSTGETVTVTDLNGRTSIRQSLAPWSVIGGKTNSSHFEISSFDFLLPDGIDDQLNKRLHLLKSKLTRATRPVPINALENAGFESFEQNVLNGWDFGNHDDASIQIRIDDGQTGQASLSVETRGQPVWIRSNAFPAPQTGRLSLSVWLRSDDPTLQPALRLCVEGVGGDDAYYRFGTVGSLAAGDEASQVDGQWQRFAVHFDDLPTHENAQLRIGFDLMDAGQVAIDSVEVMDRWFDSDDARAITQLLAGVGPLLKQPHTIDRGRRILNGYWPTFLDQQIDAARAVGVQPDSTRVARQEEPTAPRQGTRRKTFLESLRQRSRTPFR